MNIERITTYHNNRIGLYGTCGNSQWRDAFYDHFGTRKLFYDPRDTYEDTHDSLLVEFDNLMRLPLTVHVITAETPGRISFLELQKRLLNLGCLANKHSVAFIDPTATSATQNDPLALHWRQLLTTQLQTHSSDTNVHIATSVDEACTMTEALAFAIGLMD